MQRPRITKKLVESLAVTWASLSDQYDDLCAFRAPRETLEHYKRTIDYLHNTIRWAKAQEKRRKDNANR